MKAIYIGLPLLNKTVLVSTSVLRWSSRRHNSVLTTRSLFDPSPHTLLSFNFQQFV